MAKAKKRKILNYRQLKVAEIWGRDRTQDQETIAAILLSEFDIKASQPTVSRDIKVLDQRNLDKSDDIIKAVKVQLMTEYEFIYGEAVAAWSESLKDRQVITKMGIEKTIRGRGNPAMFTQAQNALKSIRELYGLDAPAKLDASLNVSGKLVILPKQDD